MPPRKPKLRVPRSTDHLVTKFPGKVICGSCRVTVLAEHLWGAWFKYDVWALGMLGEIEALQRGVRTFSIDPVTKSIRPRHRLYRRAEPIPRRGYVIREHVCGTPFPPLEHRKKPADAKPEKDSQQCPF